MHQAIRRGSTKPSLKRSRNVSACRLPLTPSLSPRSGRGRDPRSGRVRGGRLQSAGQMADEDGARVPAPRANPDLIGQEYAERELRRLDEVGRLPHAILLSGPRGTGKATLAFRFARFLFSRSAGRSGGILEDSGDGGLAVDPDSTVFRRVASGGHADLLTIERAYDPGRRRLRTEIIVEDAREIARFFQLTAAEEGWRIVIVDGAEEMNRNAANALLKILEEPPRRALLSQMPGVDLGRLYTFADSLSRPGAEDTCWTSEELLSQLLARIAARAA